MQTAPLSEKRRQNLIRLVEQYGSYEKLNLMLGKKKNYAKLKYIAEGRLDTKNKPMEIDDRLAREIEEKLYLPEGLMDCPQERFLVTAQEESFASLESLNHPDSVSVTPPAMLLHKYFIAREMKIIDFSHLKVLSYLIDEMSPTIKAPALLFIDTKVNAIYDNGLYLLDTKLGVKVLRVLRRLDGSYEVSADNKRRLQPAYVDDVHAAFRVLGKVVYMFQGSQPR